MMHHIQEQLTQALELGLIIDVRYFPVVQSTSLVIWFRHSTPPHIIEALANLFETKYAGKVFQSTPAILTVNVPYVMPEHIL